MGHLDRNVTQLAPKSRETSVSEDQFNPAFVTGFNPQYREVEKSNQILAHTVKRSHSKVLPAKPKFRRAPGLRTMLAKNVKQSPKKPPTFLDHSGFYRCKRCKACNTVSMKMDTFSSAVTGKEYAISQLITCVTVDMLPIC